MNSLLFPPLVDCLITAPFESSNCTSASVLRRVHRERKARRAGQREFVVVVLVCRADALIEAARARQHAQVIRRCQRAVVHVQIDRNALRYIVRLIGLHQVIVRIVDDFEPILPSGIPVMSIHWPSRYER